MTLSSYQLKITEEIPRGRLKPQHQTPVGVPVGRTRSADLHILRGTPHPRGGDNHGGPASFNKEPEGFIPDSRTKGRILMDFKPEFLKSLRIRGN